MVMKRYRALTSRGDTVGVVAAESQLEAKRLFLASMQGLSRRTWTAGGCRVVEDEQFELWYQGTDVRPYVRATSNEIRPLIATVEKEHPEDAHIAMASGRVVWDSRLGFAYDNAP
ncbi:MAG: hypothetical protein OCU12_06360 [Methanophagales archaeon]|nr:hypothetical protein [Methanophagales archaeon]